MFLIDTAQGRIIERRGDQGQLAAEQPVPAVARRQPGHLDNLPEVIHITESELETSPRAADVRLHPRGAQDPHRPDGAPAYEALGSMGTDTPIAVLSDRPRLLFDYFAQLFAQVTNPPLDAIREELVTSLGGTIGPEGNLLDPGPTRCRLIELPVPDPRQRPAGQARTRRGGPPTTSGPSRDPRPVPVAEGGEGLRAALERIRARREAIADGANVIILSDRKASDEDLAPIPSLLLTAAVHHHLVREKTRTRSAWWSRPARPARCTTSALLIGYGAAAVNPYLAFETIEDMDRPGCHDVALRPGGEELHQGRRQGRPQGDVQDGHLHRRVLHRRPDLRGRRPRRGARRRVLHRHHSRSAASGSTRSPRRWRPPRARPTPTVPRSAPTASSRWRRVPVAPRGRVPPVQPEDGLQAPARDPHRPATTCSRSTRAGRRPVERLATLRGLFELKPGDRPVPLDEVEPASEIVKRFSTGAMSYGSISPEAHETLAIAMNRLGAKSNTGEGGEDPERFYPMDNGDRSAARSSRSPRAASASPASTSSNADDIQIKMAQGAKPGEGGQLPGHKVYPWVAKTRHSTPGVGSSARRRTTTSTRSRTWPS
jgi:glutamate synthase (NADPH/NADH) large chain